MHTARSQFENFLRNAKVFIVANASTTQGVELKQHSQATSARRAAQADVAVSSHEIDIDVVPSTGRARRSRGTRFGRGAVASALAGAMAASVMFGIALTQRDTANDLSSDSVNNDLALPSAAMDAAQVGFADRSGIASRSEVRSQLSEAIANDEDAERDEAVTEQVVDTQYMEAQGSAEEREAAMAADMLLVEQQEEKLQKEAEEARLKLQEAQRLAAEGSDGSDASFSITPEELAAISSGGGAYPVPGRTREGAGFGATGSWSRYHTGQDFPAPVGTPIYAAASGIVLSPTAGGWAGINTVIQHANGGATLYAHMSRRVVNPGQTVKAGQLIGYVGMTGRTFGPHLHFEYYKPGVTPGKVYSASDPMAFLASLGVR